MNEEVSIITPYRNSAKFLPRFVASIQSQTRTDWVCLMVDDGSTDNGPHELRQLVSGDPRFLLLTNGFLKTSPGPASARNYALARVKTKLVAFCDVDDIWHPQKLHHQLAFHSLHNLDLSVSAYARFSDKQMDQPPVQLICPPQKLSLKNLKGKNPIPMLTVILSTDLAHSGFQQIAHEDFLFWLDLFRSQPSLRFGCIPLVLAFYCVHNDNLTSRKLNMPLWTYRVFLRHTQSKTKSLALLGHWLIAHIYEWFLHPLIKKPGKLAISQLLEMPPLHLRQDG